MIRRGLVIAAAVLAMAVGMASAAAGEVVTIEAEGRARVGDGARTRALDAAFAEAVDEALSRMLPSATREEHQEVLGDRVVRRARLFVSQFRVTGEREIEGSLHVRIDAEVRLDRIRDRLVELGIDEVTAGPAPPAGERPGLVLLLHATVGEDTAVTFGREGGEGGPAAAAFAGALREQGFELIPSEGESVAASVEAPADVPVGDAAAAELARRLGAGGAIVVGLEVASDGPVRGTTLRGAAGGAVVRVVDAAEGALVARTHVQGADFADTEAEAFARAAGVVGARAMDAVASTMARHWPLPLASTQGVDVHVRGFERWGGIQELIEALDDVAGIEEVYPRSFRSDEVVLAVVTELDSRRIASVANAVRTDEGRVRARVVDEERVEARVE